LSGLLTFLNVIMDASHGCFVSAKLLQSFTRHSKTEMMRFLYCLNSEHGTWCSR